MDVSQKAKNKEQDFSDIEKAAEVMENRMRMDEEHPDLLKQLQLRTDVAGSHRYFVEPYKSTFGSMIEHNSFVPFPKEIMQQYNRVECASFMGILPEINRVWMTVDNILFLWNYEQPDDCLVFDDVSEVIVSVALSTPKPGIFLDSVKYLLVLATPVEIVVLALCEGTGGGDAQNKTLKIVPTTYRLPSDNVTMLKIAGSQCGRVFMLGNDHGLYELEYSNTETTWRDALLGHGEGGSRKCRKVNHLGWNWQVAAVLPGVFGVVAEDPFVEILVDNARNVLYAITRHGKLSVLYLGVDGKSTHQVIHDYDLHAHIKEFLQRNAYSGVFSVSPSSFTNVAAPSFNVVGLFAVPLQDSQALHLLVVLASGIRVFLSLEREPHGAGFSTQWAMPVLVAQDEPPRGLAVRGVRAPPSAATIAQCARERAESDENAALVDLSTNTLAASSVEDEGGALPSFVPSQPLAVSRALCAGGVCLLALDKQQQPDELLCLFEDLFSRKSAVTATPTMASSSSSTAFSSQSGGECAAALREGVALGLTAAQSGGKILDVRESALSLRDAHAQHVQSLFAFSRSPRAVGTLSRELRTHHVPREEKRESEKERERSFFSEWFGTSGEKHEKTHKATYTQETPLSLCNAMSSSCAASLALHTGIERENLANLASLSEVARQQCPVGLTATQSEKDRENMTFRRLVVLTTTGVHILRKLRPVDLVYRVLAQIDVRGAEHLQRLFAGYGALQTSAMCVGLAVGVPRSLSVCAGVDLESEHLAVRAMQSVMASTAGPACRIVVPAPGYGSARGVTSTEFTPSTTHDALYLFLSRQLRAVWFRPVFSLGEREKERGVGLSAQWDEALLAELRVSLSQLDELMMHFFGASIRTSSSLSSHTHTERESGRERETERDRERARGRDLVTAQLDAQASRAQSLSLDRELALRAKDAEDASLRALYLLLSRATHALAYIEWLVAAQNTWHVTLTTHTTPSHNATTQNNNTIATLLREIDKWSFRAIVLSPRAHDVLKRLSFYVLHEVLARSRERESADRATHWLCERAYHFFSAGDRYAFEAHALLQEIERERERAREREHAALLTSSLTQDGGDVLHEKASRCVELLTRAAQFWVSLESVCGGESELRRACDAVLVALGPIGRDCVVDLCLFAATNFAPSLSHTQQRETRTARTPSAEELWDSALYHGGSALGERERDKAVLACYECLADMIFSLAKRANSIDTCSQLSPAAVDAEMLRMAQRALRASADRRLHELLFARLLADERATRLLLELNSPFVEEFLQTHDANVLYAYYIASVPERDAQLVKAANLMYVLAIAAEDVHVDERVEFLRKAVSCARQAAAPQHALAAGVARDRLLVDSVQELQDLLDVVEFQKEVAALLDEDFQQYHMSTSSSRGTQYNEAQTKLLQEMKTCVRRLKTKLLSISELFNDVCVPYHLWNASLRLLEISGTLDEELIKNIWRSYIYRFVPSYSAVEESAEFLSRKKSPSYVMVDARFESLLAGKAFERPEDWLSPLLTHVSTLAKQLKVENVSSFAPVTLLVHELEAICNTLHVIGQDAHLSHTVVSDLLTELRVPTPYTVASYFSLLEEWDQNVSSESQVHLVSTILAVIEKWIRAAQHNHGSEEMGYLELAIMDGHMRQWLADISKRLTVLKRDSRFPELVEELLKKEHDISGRVFDFHQQQ